jgi:hypothetical protein
LPTGFDPDHTSITAAVLKVSYQGDWDNVSGNIEIGLVMNDDISITGMPCVGLEHIKKTYLYECHKLVKGVRAIYIPINDAMLE